VNEPLAPGTEHSGPAHSIWPMVVAVGLTQALLGLVTTSLAFEVTGALAVLVGIVGWLREL
jgi:membrane-bound metal-dependent hydrolase YbcI (DUF457 family)